MDHSPKKKSQKKILIKLKSWTKKLTSSKSNNSSSSNNLKHKQPERNNDTIPQIAHPSLDDSGIVSRARSGRDLLDESLNKNVSRSGTLNNDNVKTSTMLSTIEERKTSTFNMFSTTSIKAAKQEKIISPVTKNSSRRDSFFGISRLNSRLSSRMSRFSSTTISNNPVITSCSLPEFVEEPFDIDFIFNDFDCEIDESDESVEFNEFNNLSESSNLPNLNENDENDLEILDYYEFYNALPVIKEDEPTPSLTAPPPNPTTLTNIYSSPLSEGPLRVSIMEVECEVCTYVNHPIMTVCEICRALLPCSSTRSSQYSTAFNNNNKSVISDAYANNITLMKTQMTLMKKIDEDFTIVKSLFYSEIPRAIIKGIFRLEMPTKLVKVHEKYKSKVAAISGRSVDDVTYSMFHGTTTLFDCDPDRFLEKNYLNDKSFCKKGCGMCGIIQHGNKKKFSKHSKKMWFAHSALISRDYTDNNCCTKVMFVVDVVAEEHNWILVVNKNKATLPRFMILFE